MVLKVVSMTITISLHVGNPEDRTNSSWEQIFSGQTFLGDLGDHLGLGGLLSVWFNFVLLSFSS